MSSAPSVIPRPGEGARGLEQRSIDYVPESERRGRVGQQGVFWFVSNTQTLSVAVGFLGPAMGLSILWTVIATLLGTIIGTTFTALHASQGPHLGLPQMLQSRAQFGYRGVIIPLIAALFGNVAYLILDVVLLTVGLHAIFGINAVLIGVVATLLTVVLAVFGYDWMHRAFKWFFWISLPFWAALSIAILTGHAGGHAPSSHAGFVVVAFLVQLSYAASINLSYATVVSDYSRYLPRTTPFRRIIGTVFSGMSGSLIWLVAIGAWLASSFGASDALVGVDQAGNDVFPHFGDVLAIVSSLVLVITMGLCAYSASLEALTILESLGVMRKVRNSLASVRVRAGLVVAFGILTLAIALPLKDVATTVDTLVLMVFYVLVPWTSINLVDYFFVRRGRYAITHLDKPDGVYGAWSWRGIVAYLVGLASIVPFMNLSFFVGPLVAPLKDVDVSWVVGLIVSSIVYFAFTRSLDLSRDAQAIADSDAELQSLGLAAPAEEREVVPEF